MAAAALKKGTWSITRGNHSDIPVGPVNDISEVYLVWFPVGEAIRRGSNTFGNAFEGNDVAKSFYEAVFQLMLKVWADLQLTYLAKETTLAGQNAGTNPFSLFVETVVGSAPTEYDIPGQYGNTQRDADERLFMAGIPDEIPVVEIRLWFFVHNATASLDFGKLFYEHITDLEKAFLTKYSSDTPAPSSSRKRRNDKSADDGNAPSLGAQMATYAPTSEAMGTRYGQSLGPNEKWKLVRSAEEWARVADMMFGYRKFTSVENIRKWAVKPLDISMWALHPRYVLSPYNYFFNPHAMACEQQKLLANYMNTENGGSWKFPRPDCVVRVAHSDETIARMRSKLLPEYQARTIREYDIDKDMHRTLAVGVLGPSSRHTIPMKGQQTVNTATNHIGRNVMPVRGNGIALQNEYGLVLHRPMPNEEEMEENMGYSLCDGVIFGGVRPAEIIAMIQSTPVEVDERGLKVLQDLQSLQRSDYEPATTLLNQMLLFATDRADASAIHAIRHVGSRLKAEFNAKESDMTMEEAHAALNLRRMRLFRDYCDSCTTSKSDIFIEGRHINAWFEDLQAKEFDRLYDNPNDASPPLTWLGHDEKLFDASLSTFGNMMIRRMARLESVGFVSTCHWLVMLLLVGGLDAYRHDLDLHYNLLIAGPPAFGKSFALLLMQKLRIPHTVQKVSMKTNKADFTDKYHNDQIHICEEVLPSEFKTGKNGGNDDSEAMNKEYLTSMVRILKTFCTPPNGERSARVVFTQQIGAQFKATNASLTEFSAGVKSRFGCLELNETNRPERHVSDLQGIEKHMSKAQLALFGKLQRELQAEQYLNYHINKLIEEEALTTPTLSALYVIQQIFRQYLRERYCIEPHPRMFARAELQARTLTISLACEYLFSNPASKHYKKPFDMRQLIDVDPLLHDNEEIACFALEMQHFEVVDDARYVFLRAFFLEYVEKERQLILNSPEIDPREKATKLAQIYMTPQTIVDTSTAINMQLARRPPADANSGFRAAFEPSPFGAPSNVSPPVAAGGDARRMADQHYPPHYMYAYSVAAVSMAQLGITISALTGNNFIKLTKEHCLKFVGQLREQTIHGHTYRWDDAEHKPVVASEGLISMPAAIVVTNAIFLHNDLARDCDAVSDAIAYTVSKTLPPNTSRRYLVPRILSPATPYLYSTRVVRPEDGRDHKVTYFDKEVTKALVGGFQEAKGWKTTTGKQDLVKHYDDISEEDRCRVLYYKYPEKNAASFALYERAARRPARGGQPGEMRHVRYPLEHYPSFYLN